MDGGHMGVVSNLTIHCSLHHLDFQTKSVDVLGAFLMFG
jgi:hypothetical protein